MAYFKKIIDYFGLLKYDLIKENLRKSKKTKGGLKKK